MNKLEECVNVRSERYCIASSFARCWHCKKDTDVYSLMLPAGYETVEVDIDEITDEEIEFWETSSCASLLYYIEYLPPVVASRMRQVAPLYRPAYSKMADQVYYANHCEHCGVIQGDFYLYCEPGTGFFSYNNDLDGIELTPINEPLEAVAGGFTMEFDYDDSYAH